MTGERQNRQDRGWAVRVGFRLHYHLSVSLSFIECSCFGSLQVSLSFMEFFCVHRTETFRVSISNPTLYMIKTEWKARENIPLRTTAIYALVVRSIRTG